MVKFLIVQVLNIYLDYPASVCISVRL